MSDAEVMPPTLVAALFFGGSHERARALEDERVLIQKELLTAW